MDRFAALALVAPALAACGTEPVARAPWHAPETEYALLSETGFFDAGDLVGFEPAVSLWADGAQKRRFIRLPEGESIDTRDMDHWKFPIGTQLFKEFSKDGVLLETRMIERRGEDDYFFGAFLWREDGSDAELVDGAEDMHGTTLDSPARSECMLCHGGEPGRVLGYSAVQLGEHEIPGDSAMRDALGFLHANCGHCHNPDGLAADYNTLELRISVKDFAVEDTAAFKTAIGVPLSRHLGELGLEKRIVPGRPEESAVYVRMSRRGEYQMPMIGTELRNLAGEEVIRRWIASMPVQ